MLQENHVKIEKVRAYISQFNYTDVMMNMKLLAVVSPPSIYHVCSTRKTFWKENITGEEKLFSTVNMENLYRRNVRKHREIKCSDKYVTLYISLKIDSQDKMKITSSDSKKKNGNIRKGVDCLSGFQGQSKATQMQKGKVCHQKCQ